jgi:GTPase Era involved in 16S rRNA processing
MKHPVQLLESQLNRIRDLLDQGSFFSVTAEERQSLRGEVQSLATKVAAIEDGFLTIGLLGGTGVGKSTLMNALAGSRIASTSHRRPHTDEVLIYRHVAANPLPALDLGDIPWQEITHESHAIRQILLCDLPDFDSLMGEHRRHVQHFLEHLDVLVWVTSPEKYADGRFYEFLETVPKAKQNFYFLLNKADLLFDGETLETGYEQMASVGRSFQEHVKASGIVEPLFFALAAEKVLASDQLAPWNQFPAFRQQIFQQRDIKQITAIKAANLDVEVQQLLSAFQKEILNLKDFERILEGSVKELREKHASWVKAGEQTIDLWLKNHIRPEILSNRSDLSSLLGPGYTLALFLQEWQKRFTEERKMPSDLSLLTLPEEIAVSFRRRIEWLQDRLDHHILRKNLASSFRKRLREVLDVSKTFEDLGERFSEVLALRLSEPSWPSFWGFRGLQSLTYLLLLAFFLLAIGGQTAWREVIADPGATSIFHLLLSGIHTLFSTKGLAALGSYALLNLFFAIRFYRRYKKLSRQVTQQIIESLKVGLGTVWKEELDSILDDLNQFRADIRSHIAAISALRQERNITS